MSKDAAVDLVRALIENMRGAADGWESLAMVLDLDGNRFGGTSGYTYGPAGTISAVASRPSAVRPAVDAYLATCFQPGDAWPVKLLVQFNRTTGDYEATFEDADVSRWKVTPDNIDTIREELRPRFD